METLVMPMNYVELQEDEMMYLDGGWSAILTGKNLIKLGANIWGGYLLVQAGKIMLSNAHMGLLEAVAKVGYAAHKAFVALPLWAQIAVGVGTLATIWALGTWEF